jgi:alpha-tubulin suppressor-like RCC1 family protein
MSRTPRLSIAIALLLFAGCSDDGPDDGPNNPPIDASPDAPVADASPAPDAPGVDASPPPTTRVAGITAGDQHTCVVFETGLTRCWGMGFFGVLGYGELENIGDDETPGCKQNLQIGGLVTQAAAGGAHTCARLTDGSVRCWGAAFSGALGYGDIADHIGDTELPASAGDVDVGGAVTQLTAGDSYTCAVLEGGALRCWGRGRFGALGYGNGNDIGDDETPASAGDVDVGGAVVQIAAGGNHTCAVLEGGALRCWGNNALSELGHGGDIVGDDETPASVPPVEVGGTVSRVAAGSQHTCAILGSGAVRCWGRASEGQLGYGNTSVIGDDETPASAGDVDVGGGTVVDIQAGTHHNCVLLDTGALRCWGRNADGQLGYGHTSDIGDDETPASAGDVDVGGPVVAMSLGERHTCAVLDTGAVRCWGKSLDGQLGHGYPIIRGDDEPASTGGDVPLHTCAMPSECEGGGPAACQPDSFEPNEDATAARLVSTTEGYHDAFLCAGEEDWYLVPASQNGPANVSVNVAVLHALYQNDCNICVDGALPSCAHNTITVEIYDAATGTLLAMQTKNEGYVWLPRANLPAADLHVRVYGDATAGFGYRIWPFVMTYEPACDNSDCQLPRFCDHC